MDFHGGIRSLCDSHQYISLSLKQMQISRNDTDSRWVYTAFIRRKLNYLKLQLVMTDTVTTLDTVIRSYGDVIDCSHGASD